MDAEDVSFEVEEKQYEEVNDVCRKAGLIVSDYDFPQNVTTNAFRIYTQLMSDKYFERINKISHIAFICFYFASQEAAYFRTPQEIAERVGVKKTMKLMMILKDYSHMYTSYRRVPVVVRCLDVLSEYRIHFSVIDTQYDEVVDMWKQIVKSEPGMRINKNPVAMAASLIIYYMSTVGLNDAANVCDILRIARSVLNKYIDALDKIYNSS